MSVRRTMKHTRGSDTAKSTAKSNRQRTLFGRRRGKLIETLESRFLFTTIITDSDPLTPTPADASFEYKDARDNNVRVFVHGDVTAEFLFARFTADGLRLRDHVATTMPGEDGPEANDETGRDLFHVYIAQASIDSYISIAKVPSFDDDERPMLPFDGTVSLRVRPSREDEPMKTMTEGTGDIYLGARTADEDPVPEENQDVPIRSSRFTGLGIMPANSRGTLVAGLSTAPDVSLGRFQFGGVVSGQVTIQGSMQHFYCGVLLTGVTEGQFEGSPQAPNNFYVGGDIRDILVKGAIGTNVVAVGGLPTYFTGTDFEIKGKVGQIRSGAGYAAFGTIENNLSGLGLRTRQQEIELLPPPGNRGDITDFENGRLGDGDVFFGNDTFANAQFLGSINSKQTGNNSIQLNGLLQYDPEINDVADFYAVPLMAGQNVQVRLLGGLHVGVFDPDERLLATDWSSKSVNATQNSADLFDPVQNKLFSFTADRPGIYRIAVGLDAPDFLGGLVFTGEVPYQLQVKGIGNLGLGGLVSTGTIFAPFGSNSDTNSTLGRAANIEVIHGDLGAVHAINEFIIGLSGSTAIAAGGDLRAIDAASLGSLVEGLYGLGVNFDAVTGSVGMIRTTGIGPNQITNFNGGTTVPIGGDIQYVVAATQMDAYIAANGSAGVIQAPSWGLINSPGSLSVNVDGLGKPGVIDLIDITGNLGTFEVGGPDITTNVGGNVRYMRVGGQAYRPRQFGGGSPEETRFVQGQEATFTDDSGSQVVLTPTQDKVVNPTTGQVFDFSGTLTVLTYPIGRSLTDRGGGGVAIVRVDSTRGVGVRVSGGPVEIGKISSFGSGPNLIADPGPDRIVGTADDDRGPDAVPNSGDERFVTDPRSTAENSIDLRGDLVDVFEISGNNFNYVRNRTPGEIVSTNIGQTGLLEAETLGIARSSIRPGMITEGIQVADLFATSDNVEGDVFPFFHTKNVIVINGGSESSYAIADVRSRQAIGNVMILGVVQDIRANADGRGIRGVHEGINGVLFVRGQLREVNIGEGVLPSGSGEFSHAGIYAIAVAGNTSGFGLGRIERVVNQGDGSDIRGDIISNTAIGEIILNNGSIINADIGVVSGIRVAEGEEEPEPTGFSGALLTPSREFALSRVIAFNGNIDNISLTGNGGIIGSTFVAFNVNNVVVSGGFGIVNTYFATVGTGRFGNFIADGYGIRGGIWDGGQSVQTIHATGLGNRLKTTAFSASVRYSETQAIDPFFGTQPNSLTDLHMVLGTTKAAPTRKGISNSGQIDASAVAVSRDLGSIEANSIRSTNLAIGNNIGRITNHSYAENIRVSAGRITSLLIGKDALYVDVSASGPIGDVMIGGAFRGTSRLAATGTNGTIGTFVTGTTLYGNIYAQKHIGSIRVGTHYGSLGSRSGGSLGDFITNGNLSSGSKFTVNKSAKRLVVGGSVEDDALFEIDGTLGTKTIIGDEIGQVIVHNDV